MWNLRQCFTHKLYKSIIWGSRLLFLVTTYSCSSSMVPSEFSCCSNTGKVIFEWCKQVADNRDAPWPAQEPLPCQSAHVGHVRIVDWEAKDPDRKTSQTTKYKTTKRTDSQTDKGIREDTGRSFWDLIAEKSCDRVWRAIFTFTYLSISVHQSMSSFSFM